MIIRANASQIPLADNSVHCVVTSPPYWGLRKYDGEQETAWPDGMRCGYGLEPTIEAYVEHSIVILREVRRVLRDDGLCWWNLGDSYFGSWGNYGGQNRGNGEQRPIPEGSKAHQKSYDGLESWRPPTAYAQNGLKPLDLCLIPDRVALAAQANGWYVRSMVIWSKPNPMPESVNGWRWERHRVKVASNPTPEANLRDMPPHGWGERDGNKLGQAVAGRPALAQWSDCPGCEKCAPNDGLILRKGSWRPTDAYEHILMLAKSAEYFGDAEAVKEPQSSESIARRSRNRFTAYEPPVQVVNSGLDRPVEPGASRNLRNVWTFPTQPYPEAPFANFPERLPEICIKASTSERGCCPKCGAQWARVIARTVEFQSGSGKAGNQPAGKWETDSQAESGDYDIRMGPVVTNSTLGWRPTCDCNAGEPVPCTVLDPFGGSGTTARVALRLNRRPILLDLAYHGLQTKRMRYIQPELVLVR